MAVLVYPFNTSGFGAAFGAADQGADVYAVEPTYWPGAMWLNGLEQTDRENTFAAKPNDHIRQGWVDEMCRINAVKNGVTTEGAHNVFPDFVTQNNTHFEKLAKYAVRKPASGSTPAQGKITYLKEHQLIEVIRSPLKPYPITGAKFIDASTAERKIVTLNFTQIIDCTDEGDIAVRVCTTNFGRESVSSIGIMAAGLTRPLAVNALAVDENGERLAGLPPKPPQRLNMADRRVMAFGMRVLVTQDAARIPFDSFEIPGYDPRKYDGDLRKAVAMNYKTIPGSISNSPMKPGGPIGEFDMNNGGGLRVGLNWPGRFLNWFKMTWQEREDYKDKYIIEKCGLFKAICSDPAWAAALPELVADTKTWGYVPGLFTFPAWQANQSVQLGTRKFKAPYIYEVTSVEQDSIVYTTFPPAAWTQGTAYAIGNQRTAGDNRYEATQAGTSAVTGTGPSGTGASITDGTVIWKWIGVTTPTALTAFRAAGDTTTPITGPSGTGTAVPDGTRVKWKVHRPFFPGMSPWLYIREGRKISGQACQTFELMCLPSKDVSEPLVPYGYPYFDVHWNNEYVGDDGKFTFEGMSLQLLPEQEAAASFMQFGSIKPAYDECPNLLVARCICGDRLGWVPVRIELSYIKVAQAAGIVAGIADQLGIYTGDVDYNTYVRPALLKAGFTLTVPKAA